MASNSNNFFDPSSFSDNELYEKMQQLNQKLNMIYKTNQNQETIDQIQRYIEMLQSERNERQNPLQQFYNDENENNKKGNDSDNSGVVLETDPDMK